MIEGILFDLDGVLVSTDELHYLAWKQLADRLGICTGTYEKAGDKRQRKTTKEAGTVGAATGK